MREAVPPASSSRALCQQLSLGEADNKKKSDTRDSSGSGRDRSFSIYAFSFIHSLMGERNGIKAKKQYKNPSGSVGWVCGAGVCKPQSTGQIWPQPLFA